MDAGGREHDRTEGAEPTGPAHESCSCVGRGPLLMLAGGLMFLLVNNALWTLESPVPVPMYNLHEHFELLTEALRRVQADGLAGLWELWSRGYYPPLLHLFGWGLKGLLGSHWYFVYVPGALSMLGLGLGTTLAGSALFGRRAGAFAGLFAASCPIVVGLSRTFDPPLPGAALVALAIGVALRSEGFTRALPTLSAFGLATIAAMTNRVIPLLHVALPFFLVELSGRRSGRHRTALVAGVAMLCLLAGPFHLNWMVQWLSNEGSLLQVPGPAGAGGFESLRSWLYYVLVLPDNQFHLPLSLAVMLALPSLAAAGPFQRRLLAAWWLAPALILTLLPRKDPAFDLPGLPALAILVGWGLDHAIDRVRAAAAAPGRPRAFRRLSLRFRATAFALLPALLLATMFSDTLIGSWTPYADLLATEALPSVRPAAQWMQEPIGGRAEVSFILEVLGQMVHDIPPPGEIRVAETADYAFSMPVGYMNTADGVRFWQAYAYRATLPYVAELHGPRVKVASTLWPKLSEWKFIFEEFDKLHYLLFTTRGEVEWPSGRTLARIRERFDPVLSQTERARADQFLDNVIRSRPRFVRIARRYVPRYGYYLLVYRRADRDALPLPPPPR